MRRRAASRLQATRSRHTHPRGVRRAAAVVRLPHPQTLHLGIAGLPPDQFPIHDCGAFAGMPAVQFALT